MTQASVWDLLYLSAHAFSFTTSFGWEPVPRPMNQVTGVELGAHPSDVVRGVAEMWAWVLGLLHPTQASAVAVGGAASVGAAVASAAAAVGWLQRRWVGLPGRQWVGQAVLRPRDGDQCQNCDNDRQRNKLFHDLLLLELTSKFFDWDLPEYFVSDDLLCLTFDRNF